jgi:hypothetical protein
MGHVRGIAAQGFSAAVALCVMVATSAAPGIGDTTPMGAVPDSVPHVSFNGRVGSGGRMERALPGGLRFRLVPQAGSRDATTSGWRIQVIGADTLEDYAAIATPPYHGVNDLGIDAWHFRNKDNTGSNDGSVSAPQDLREFRFVTDTASYRREAAALDIVLWPGDRPGAVRDSAMAVLDSMPTGEGRLEITHMTLSGLGAGVEPYFLDMDFQVELRWPAKPPVSHEH